MLHINKFQITSTLFEIIKFNEKNKVFLLYETWRKVKYTFKIN